MLHRSKSFLLFCLALALAPLSRGDERRSLEDFLREARARRDALAAELGTVVQATVAELEELAGTARTDEVAALRAKLAALGPPAAPILVPYLDPGENLTAASVFRAQQVVEVLQAIASPAITDPLLALARSGSVARRVNALAVLSSSSEPERVVGVLEGLLAAEESELRQAALAALGRLGGERALVALRAALEDESPEVVRTALAGLGNVPGDEVAQLVRDTLQRPGAEAHLGALVAFYSTRPELFQTEEHQTAVAELVARPGTARSDAIAMLELWNQHTIEPRPAARRALEGLAEHVNDELREHTLLLLARAKDKGARRVFLEPYNDRVDRQGDYFAVYSERAQAYYRLGEYQSAIKDYKESIRLQSARNPDAEAYLGLARTYARMERFKEAADYLNLAPVALPVLRALASDPAFAKMLESRYKSSFHLDG